MVIVIFVSGEYVYGEYTEILVEGSGERFLHRVVLGTCFSQCICLVAGDISYELVSVKRIIVGYSLFHVFYLLE